MNGYFRPLRRKLGVVTLLMACVLTAGWVRSRTAIDLLFIPRVFIVISDNGGISISQSVRLKTSKRDGSVVEGTLESTAYSSEIKHREWNPVSTEIIEMDYGLIPLWPLVMPLTLLSAYLLLSKPRRNQKSP